MLRAAAKNHAFVTLVVDAGDYARVLADQREHDGANSAGLRRRLAAKGFAHSADYDCAITAYLDGAAADGAAADDEADNDGLPQLYARHYYKHQDLRYGENPHQAAAVYTPAN